MARQSDHVLSRAYILESKGILIIAGFDSPSLRDVVGIRIAGDELDLALREDMPICYGGEVDLLGFCHGCMLDA